MSATLDAPQREAYVSITALRSRAVCSGDFFSKNSVGCPTRQQIRLPTAVSRRRLYRHRASRRRRKGRWPGKDRDAPQVIRSMEGSRCLRHVRSRPAPEAEATASRGFPQRRRRRSRFRRASQPPSAAIRRWPGVSEPTGNAATQNPGSEGHGPYYGGRFPQAI